MARRIFLLAAASLVVACSTPTQNGREPATPNAGIEAAGGPDLGHDVPFGGTLNGSAFVPKGAIAVATEDPNVKRIVIADYDIHCDGSAYNLRDGARQVVFRMEWTRDAVTDLAADPATIGLYTLSNWDSHPATGGHAGVIGGATSVGGTAQIRAHVEWGRDYLEGHLGVRVCSLESRGEPTADSRQPTASGVGVGASGSRLQAPGSRSATACPRCADGLRGKRENDSPIAGGHSACSLRPGA